MTKWKRGSGGCDVASVAEYPCDDEYQHVETGEIVRVHTTFDQHFNMPEEVDSMAEVYALLGAE